jgi:hypothetical protein
MVHRTAKEGKVSRASSTSETEIRRDGKQRKVQTFFSFPDPLSVSRGAYPGLNSLHLPLLIRSSPGPTSFPAKERSLEPRGDEQL